MSRNKLMTCNRRLFIVNLRNGNTLQNTPHREGKCCFEI